ncbi:MAG TPA: Wzz/FepE/Etk N-terminal domain-containing protein [Acidimicrobiales bacterium]|nr:Wzz/FepE/Etk N-terminal domain-containing protein [Acidimicrobiales bacterium]
MDQVIDTADSPASPDLAGDRTTTERNHFGGPEHAARPEQSGIAEYARVLWRRKWIIVITAVVAVVGVLGYCVLTTKSYSATATVLLYPPVSPLLQQAQSANPTAALVNVQDVIQVMESSSISHLVAKTIPNPPSISVAQVGTLQTTDIVQMTASDSDPQVAAAAANAYANDYINFQRGITKSTFESEATKISSNLNTLNLAISNLNAQIRATPAGVNQNVEDVQLGDLTNQQTSLENELAQAQFYATQGQSTEAGRLITAATAPSSPSSPKTTEYVVLALIFGLIAGIGLALLVNAISSRRV